MSFPKLVPQDRIDRLREEREKTVGGVSTDPYAAGRQDDLEGQEAFLSVFSKCLSPQLACKQANISRATYNRWRSSSPDFCEQLNSVMNDWREELMSSAISRAIGYTRADEEGNLIRDASGKVVYAEGSDSLARQLLQMDAGVKGEAGVNVQVNIDLGALGVTADTFKGETVNGEYVEVEPGQ